MKTIATLMHGINPLLMHAIAVAFTLVVVLNKVRRLSLPRSFILFCWYWVVVVSIFWISFNTLFILTQSEGESRLVAIVGIVTFVPVYICGLILAFFYPKEAETS